MRKYDNEMKELVQGTQAKVEREEIPRYQAWGED